MTGRRYVEARESINFLMTCVANAQNLYSKRRSESSTTSFLSAIFPGKNPDKRYVLQIRTSHMAQRGKI
jgi:hypothetical protein